MVRENSTKIRVLAGNLDFWVVDRNDDIRPYRILIKKIKLIQIYLSIILKNCKLITFHYSIL